MVALRVDPMAGTDRAGIPTRPETGRVSHQPARDPGGFHMARRLGHKSRTVEQESGLTRLRLLHVDSNHGRLGFFLGRNSSIFAGN